MNEKEFSRALGEINEKYLDEAIDYRKKRNYFYLIHVAALAACLCLVLVGALEIGKKQNKREISGSVPGVSDDNSNGINSLEDAINHFKDTQIIWGDGDRNESGDIEDDSAAKPEPSAPEDANPPLSYLSWNGINVSADLVDMYNNNASKEVVFAVGAYYIEYSGMNLSDFEYNGVTFSQLQDEIAEIEALPQKLEILLKVAYYYGTEDGMYLESLIEEIGEDGKEFANSYFEDGNTMLCELKRTLMNALKN